MATKSKQKAKKLAGAGAFYGATTKTKKLKSTVYKPKKKKTGSA